MTRLGIVIPAYNEERHIVDCLNSLSPFQGAGDTLLVVNACSSDRTADLAQAIGIHTITIEERERGTAVRKGVNNLIHASPSLTAILIAHADMIFPSQARERLVQALDTHTSSPGGAFGHRIDDSRWIFRLIEWGNNFRGHIFSLPYGDQAQFFRPYCLPCIGGFPEHPFMEDLELSLCMRKLGPLIWLNLPVRIPSRHWQNGVLRTTLRNWWTLLRYRCSRPKKIIPVIRGDDSVAPDV